MVEMMETMIHFSNQSLNFGVWNNWTVVWSGGNTQNYINGTLDSTQ